MGILIGLCMLNSSILENSSSTPQNKGLPIVDVLWGSGAGGGQVSQNVSMSYSCTERALHSGTSQRVLT